MSERNLEDLLIVKGIGPTLAEKLANAGITSLVALANLSEDDTDRLESDLDIKPRNRIVSENWVGQARDILERRALERVPPAPAEPDTPPNPEETETEAGAEPSPALSDAELLAELQRRGLAGGGDNGSAPRKKGVLRRLDKNKKYAEIVGNFTEVPGAHFEQKRGKETVYFNQEGIEIDSDLDPDVAQIEVPRMATDDDINPINWLDGKADYPFSMIRRYIRSRYNKTVENENQARKFLHETHRQPH